MSGERTRLLDHKQIIAAALHPRAPAAPLTSALARPLARWSRGCAAVAHMYRSTGQRRLRSSCSGFGRLTGAEISPAPIPARRRRRGKPLVCHAASRGSRRSSVAQRSLALWSRELSSARLPGRTPPAPAETRSTRSWRCPCTCTRTSGRRDLLTALRLLGARRLRASLARKPLRRGARNHRLHGRLRISYLGGGNPRRRDRANDPSPGELGRGVVLSRRSGGDLDLLLRRVSALVSPVCARIGTSESRSRA